MPQPVPMPVTLEPSSGTAYFPAQAPSTTANYYDSLPSTATQTPISAYTITPPTIPSNKGAVSQTLPARHQTRSLAWNPQDDGTLLQARAQGQGWTWIQQEFFPNRTPKACRNRHARLMERKDAGDWDECKTQHMAKEYMSMRKEIWGLLAQRMGEKWNVIEQKCMSSGIESLQAAARAHARRQSLGSDQSLPHDYDSDIDGIGSHTSLDDLDAPYSLPEDIPAGGASGNTPQYGAAYSTAVPPVQTQGWYPRYYGGGGCHYHGYISSISSVGTAQGPSSGGGPHMRHGNRLSSVDVGNSCVINGPGDGGGMSH